MNALTTDVYPLSHGNYMYIAITCVVASIGVCVYAYFVYIEFWNKRKQMNKEQVMETRLLKYENDIQELQLHNQWLKLELEILKRDLLNMKNAVNGMRKHAVDGFTVVHAQIGKINKKIDDESDKCVTANRELKTTMAKREEQRSVELAVRKLHDDHATLYSKYAVMHSKFGVLERQIMNTYVFIGTYLLNGGGIIPMFIKSDVSSFDYIFQSNVNCYWQMMGVGRFQLQLSGLCKTNIKEIDIETMCGNQINLFVDDEHIAQFSPSICSRDAFNDTGIVNLIIKIKKHLYKHNIQLILPMYFPKYE